jgi:hypothetical protein
VVGAERVDRDEHDVPPTPVERVARAAALDRRRRRLRLDPVVERRRRREARREQDRPAEERRAIEQDAPQVVVALHRVRGRLRHGE